MKIQIKGSISIGGRGQIFHSFWKGVRASALMASGESEEHPGPQKQLIYSIWINARTKKTWPSNGDSPTAIPAKAIFFLLLFLLLSPFFFYSLPVLQWRPNKNRWPVVGHHAQTQGSRVSPNARSSNINKPSRHRRIADWRILHATVYATTRSAPELEWQKENQTNKAWHLWFFCVCVLVIRLSTIAGCCIAAREFNYTILLPGHCNMTTTQYCSVAEPKDSRQCRKLRR